RWSSVAPWDALLDPAVEREAVAVAIPRRHSGRARRPYRRTGRTVTALRSGSPARACRTIPTLRRGARGGFRASTQSGRGWHGGTWVSAGWRVGGRRAGAEGSWRAAIVCR